MEDGVDENHRDDIEERFEEQIGDLHGRLDEVVKHFFPIKEVSFQTAYESVGLKKLVSFQMGAIFSLMLMVHMNTVLSNRKKVIFAAVANRKKDIDSILSRYESINEVAREPKTWGLDPAEVDTPALRAFLSDPSFSEKFNDGADAIYQSLERSMNDLFESLQSGERPTEFMDETSDPVPPPDDDD